MRLSLAPPTGKVTCVNSKVSLPSGQARRGRMLTSAHQTGVSYNFFNTQAWCEVGLGLVREARTLQGTAAASESAALRLCWWQLLSHGYVTVDERREDRKLYNAPSML